MSLNTIRKLFITDRVLFQLLFFKGNFHIIIQYGCIVRLQFNGSVVHHLIG